MWAPQLLSYCDPILVHGVGRTFSGGKLQKHKGFFFFPLLFYLFPTASSFTGYISNLCSSFYPEAHSRAGLEEMVCMSVVETTNECQEVHFVVRREF